MNFIKAQIVPHLPGQHGVQLWVRANHSTVPSTNIPQLVQGGVLRVATGSGNVAYSFEFSPEKYPFANWAVAGYGGKSGDRVWRRLVYRRFGVDNLEPDTYYVATIEFSDGTKDHCDFRTMPGDLSSPLIVGLASCYWGRDDKDRKLNKRWIKMIEEVGQVPHVTFLVGDQVYLDQPPLDEWLTRKSMDDLRSFLTGRYELHWGRLTELLRHGTKMFLPDDHEFWNNYPGLPGTPWRALMASSQYRRDVADYASSLFDAYQGAAPAYEMALGEDLALFVMDTRRYRNREGTRFVDNEILDQFEAWVRSLRQPGVVVLSQPLFQPAFGGRINFEGGVVGLAAGAGGLAFGPAGAAVAASAGAGVGSAVQEVFAKQQQTHERNIGAHEPQYLRFCQILTSSPCDLLILSGEIHVSRFAAVHLERQDESTLKIYEVVSSPMSLLTTGGDDPEEVASSRVEAWPPTSAHCSKVKEPEQVDYGAAHNLNGFATLKFTRAGSGDDGRRRVKVELQYHTTVMEALAPGLPEPDGHSFTLSGLVPDAAPRPRGLAFVRHDTLTPLESLKLIPMGVGATQRFSLRLHNFDAESVALKGAVISGDAGCSVQVPDDLVIGAAQTRTINGEWEAAPTTGQIFVREAPYTASARVRVVRDSNEAVSRDKDILITVDVVLPPFPEGVTVAPVDIEMGEVAVGSQGQSSVWIMNRSSDDIVLANATVTKTSGLRIINRVARAFGTTPSPFSAGFPSGHEIIPTNRGLRASVYFAPVSTLTTNATIQFILHKKEDPESKVVATVQVSGTGTGRPGGEPGVRARLHHLRPSRLRRADGR